MRFQVESQLKDHQIALRDKRAAADRETIEQLKKQTQTTQQIVREIPKVISLPTPVTVTEPQPQTGGGGEGLPDAPLPQTGIVIPRGGQTTASRLSACQQNYLDMRKERDLAVQAQSGSFWQRAKQIGIGIAIGGAIGYAAHR
jgi:hypothetical protein